MSAGRTSPVSQLSQRAMDAAAAPIRFLMQPRDLEHPDACDFMAGNPQELALPEYVAALQAAIVPTSPAYFQYGPPPRRSVERAAEALGARLGLRLQPDDVFLTRGAASGLGTAMSTILDPGDEVIFLSPPWFFYETMIVARGAKAVRVPLTRPGFDVDVSAVQAAITARTRAMIVNTPNNPTGRVYTADNLRALAEVLTAASTRNGRPIYLLSDEAYARILFDGRRMITPGLFYQATFIIHTYSKTLLAPSQRLGYMALAPGMPEAESVRAHIWRNSMLGGGFPDTGMARALPALEDLIIDMPAIERRRDRVVDALRAMGYELNSPEGTFYVLVRSPIPDSGEFCARLAAQRVYALAGEAFEMPGWFRLSLTATDAMVDRSLPVFAAAIAEVGVPVVPAGT
ncbi:MAG TPA: aminotransferase class I/II-fold pyridoxal phosphate-dependent enzyme [Candidatus Acidoferrales bacterium]|nr:aminotransferase class I/II-fold pyridoxal phosphate-dependent enzyme [Candidatus Acidoferrales bacterium]